MESPFELPYIIVFGLSVLFIVGTVIWLIKDYKEEKEMNKKFKR